jgi:hypothetical protein
VEVDEATMDALIEGIPVAATGETRVGPKPRLH